MVEIYAMCQFSIALERCGQHICILAIDYFVVLLQHMPSSDFGVLVYDWEEVSKFYHFYDILCQCCN